MSKRKGTKSTADNHDVVGSEASTAVPVQTRASKRKSNVVPTNDTEPKENAHWPPSKRSKIKNTVNTAQVSMKKGKNPQILSNSTARATTQTPVITTTTPVRMTKRQVNKVQVTTQAAGQEHPPRRGKVPVIRLNSEDSDTSDVYWENGRQKLVDDKENQENEFDPMDNGSEDIEMFDDRYEDNNAGDKLKEEAPSFTVESEKVQDDGYMGTSIRKTPPSINAEGGTEDSPDNIRPNFALTSRALATQVTGRQAQRLTEELPMVTNSTLGIVTVPEPIANNSLKEPHWLARTNIVLNPHTPSTHTFTLNKGLQNDEIKRIISLAITRGVLLMFIMPVSDADSEDREDECNAAMCCLTMSGMKALTLNALIWAAEQHGFQGENDIADRLERGDSAKYISPLIKYVATRISLERGSLKNFSATILAAFNIDSSSAGIARATELVRESNYIYPIKRNGKFDYARPFEHEAVTRYLSEAFFSNSKFAKGFIAPNKVTLFASSIAERPLELELPKGMLAMAGCVIHAVLADVGKSRKDDFPPSGLETQWQTFIDILTGLEDSSKVNYHMFVHKLYLKASHSVALAAHGLTNQEVLSRIDFEAFARENPASETEQLDTPEGDREFNEHAENTGVSGAVNVSGNSL